MPHGNSFSRLRILQRLIVIAFVPLMTGMIGCNGSTDQPELGHVAGTITIDGIPLPGVAVTFLPDEGRPAMGKTDAKGQYQLIYIRDTPGCKIGHNRVQIGNTEDSGDDPAERVVQENTEDQALEGDDLVQEPEKETFAQLATVEIPERYNLQSELEAIVKPGENTFDFSLSSK